MWRAHGSGGGGAHMTKMGSFLISFSERVWLGLYTPPIKKKTVKEEKARVKENKKKGSREFVVK